MTGGLSGTVSPVRRNAVSLLLNISNRSNDFRVSAGMGENSKSLGLRLQINRHKGSDDSSGPTSFLSRLITRGSNVCGPAEILTLSNAFA